MSQTKLSICLILFLLSQLLFEIRAQFISSQLLRRKEQVAQKLVREIEGLELSIKNQNDSLNRRDAQQQADWSQLKQVNYSPQGRMVTQSGARDYLALDLNCDQEYENGLELDELHSINFSSRIECLNRDGGDYSGRKSTASGVNGIKSQDQNEALRMRSNFERLIDQLNQRRISRGRRWG